MPDAVYDCDSIDIGTREQDLIVVDQIEFFSSSKRRGRIGGDIADFEPRLSARQLTIAEADNANPDHHALHLESYTAAMLDLREFAMASADADKTFLVLGTQRN